MSARRGGDGHILDKAYSMAGIDTSRDGLVDRLFRRHHLGLHGPQAGIDAPHGRREQIPQPDGGIDDVIGHTVSPRFPSSALFICLILLLSASFHAKMWQIIKR